MKNIQILPLLALSCLSLFSCGNEDPESFSSIVSSEDESSGIESSSDTDPSGMELSNKSLIESSMLVAEKSLVKWEGRYEYKIGDVDIPNSVYLYHTATGFTVDFYGTSLTVGFYHSQSNLYYDYKIDGETLPNKVTSRRFYLPDGESLSIVHLANYFFGVDGRFTFVAVRVTNKYALVYELMYLPFFFIYYFSLSLRINTSAITENSRPCQFINYMISVLMNTVGLIAIFAIQYGSIADHGLMFWTTDWLFTNMLWLLIPLMFVLPILQKKIYKHTNNVYLAALATCLIFVTISMVNSVSHGYFNF